MRECVNQQFPRMRSDFYRELGDIFGVSTAEAATREELLACLEHLLTAAGNAGLMTRELRQTLVDHAAGNYRIFVSMATELLMTAAQREIITLDEKLYLQVFGRPEIHTSRRAAAAR